MTYEVLARKWRPQKFSEVVGQEHITRTLLNAIKQERVGHAYLFVGPRGTGKTTSARIFAKALNCENPGADGEPCCQCQNCLEISSCTSMDVQEIDGASHNKVEDMRELRDNVCYTPTRSKYRIYIIDEVHMLSNSAWNALLKTLEEPPKHVKFLFATTEPHKVLATIISRCQRFDLKPIPTSLIVQQLKKIIAPENIFIEDAALNAIARAAEGGMRDAQSILDQIIAFCDGHNAEKPITEQDVIDVFGLASSQELQIIVGSLIGNNQDQLFTIIQEIANKGRDLERLYEELLSYIRNLIICRLTKEPRKILQVEEEEITNLLKIAEISSPAILQRILQGLVENANGIRNALNKRVYLEATLTRITYEAHAAQIEDLIAQINYLRQQENIVSIPAPEPQAPAQIIIQNIMQGDISGISEKKNQIQIQDRTLRENENNLKIEKKVEIGSLSIQENMPNGQDSSISNYETIENNKEKAEEKVDQEPFEKIPEIFFTESSQDQGEDPFCVRETSSSITTPIAEKELNLLPEKQMKNEDCDSDNLDDALNEKEDEIFEASGVIEDFESNNEINEEESSLEDDFFTHFHQAEKIWRQVKDQMKKQLNFVDYQKCERLKAVSLINHILTLSYSTEMSEEDLLLLTSSRIQNMINKELQTLFPQENLTFQMKKYLSEDHQRNLKSSPELTEKVKQTQQVKDVCQIFNAELFDVKGVI